MSRYILVHSESLELLFVGGERGFVRLFLGIVRVFDVGEDDVGFLGHCVIIRVQVVLRKDEMQVIFGCSRQRG